MDMISYSSSLINVVFHTASTGLRLLKLLLLFWYFS